MHAQGEALALLSGCALSYTQAEFVKRSRIRKSEGKHTDMFDHDDMTEGRRRNRNRA